MSRTLTACRTGLSVAAAVVLLTACGGSDSNDAESSASSSTAESSAPQAGSEFCTEAATIEERIGSTFDSQDPTALAQAAQEAAAEIRAIEPPDEIADDWAALASGVEQIGQALSAIDFNDPNALATFQEQIGQLQTDLTTASNNVQTYLAEECGIEPSESAAPTS
jgi:hypothetical protein